MELALVHELLHLHLWSLNRVGETAEEQAIECIAQALVGLKRRDGYGRSDEEKPGPACEPERGPGQLPQREGQRRSGGLGREDRCREEPAGETAAAGPRD